MQIKKALLHRFGCDNCYYNNTTFDFKSDNKGELNCFLVCYCGESIKISYNNKWSLGNFYRHINQRHHEDKQEDIRNKSETVTSIENYFIKKPARTNSIPSTSTSFTILEDERLQTTEIVFEDQINVVSLIEDSPAVISNNERSDVDEFVESCLNEFENKDEPETSKSGNLKL